MSHNGPYIAFVATWLCAIALAATAACSGSQHTAGASDDQLLTLVENRPLVTGSALVPRGRVERTVVVFFASWCGHCKRELAQLQQVVAETPTGSVRVILVNAFEDFAGRSDQAKMVRYLREQGVSWSVVSDSPQLRELFGDIRKIPAMFVFDREGGLVAAYRRQERPMPKPDELRVVLE